MQAHVELGLLLSRYGALLTERQRAMLSMAVDEDLSLAEIAERAGISRQASGTPYSGPRPSCTPMSRLWAWRKRRGPYGKQPGRWQRGLACGKTEKPRGCSRT